MASLTKKKKKYLYIAGAVVLIVGGYYWYQKTHTTSTQVQYVTAPAEKGTLTTAVTASGNVVVDQSASVDPTITGTVANLAVNVGDKVTKGQFLFTIVNDDLSVSNAQATASLQQAQNSLDSAKLSVKQAKSDYKNGQKSTSGNTHAQNVILDKKIGIAEQGVTAAQKSYNANLDSYNNQLATAAKRTVTAPIAGTVNSVNIKNGDDLSRISSGSNAVAPIVIGDLGTLEAKVQINEVDVPNVQIGQKVMMTFSAVSGLTVSGKVTKMDSLGTIAQGVVTYNATISFDTLDPRIKSGMSVSSSIITSVKQDVIVVPNSAIKTGGNGTYVQVLSSGQTTPQQVAVQTGAANNTETEITSGLNVGDNVVTRTINPSATSATTTGTAGGGGAAGIRIPGVGGFGGGGGRIGG